MKHDRTPFHRLLVIGCVTVVTLLLVACGSSSDSGSSSTTTTTTATKGSGTSTPKSTPAPASADTSRAAFITRVDKLCSDVQRRQSELRKEAQGKQITQLAPTLLTQAKVARDLFNDVKAVTPPAEDRVPVAKFSDSIRQISVYSKALAGSIAAGHQTPMRNLSVKLVAARNREHQLGQGYGFRVCANGQGY